MRTTIINKLLSLLKICLLGGLAFAWMTAHAEIYSDYAAEPSLECHNAESPIIKETVRHKPRHVTHTHHRVHTHRSYHSTSGLATYYPVSDPTHFGDMWPTDRCECCGCGTSYAVMPVSSGELSYNLENYGPRYDAGGEEAECDDKDMDDLVWN